MAAPAPNRRTPRYATPEEMMTDLHSLLDAERAGTLTHCGAWSLGQCLGHLAAWIDYAYDGYPPELPTPLWIKLVLRPFKKKFLRGPLRPGVRIPKLKDGTLAIDPLSTPEGLSRFEKAWARLRQGPPTKPNPIFGPMTHAEWIQMHLRHAELHLSFQRAA